MNYGGGVRFWDSVGIIDSCQIIENRGGQCSGLEIMLRETIVRHTLIAENISARDYGAAYFNSCDVMMQNCTIVNNNTLGLNCHGVNCIVVNSIIWNNNNNNNQIRSTANATEIFFSDISEGRREEEGIINWHESNISEDPEFVNPNNNYHLTEDSPCIDAGDPDFPEDPDGTVPDMGAFYFPQFPVIFVDRDTLDFGEVDLEGAGFADEFFMIVNQGFQDLIITGIIIENENFVAEFDEEIVIEPDNAVDVPATFTPPDTGRFFGEMIILSNDPMHARKSVVLTGTAVWMDSVEPESEILPTGCRILTAYPNPFNSNLTITFSIDKPQIVNLKISDILGRTVQSERFYHNRVGMRNYYIDMSDLQTGALIIELGSESSMDFRRIYHIK